VLAWLSVWSEVQSCIWPSCCHCHSPSLCFNKIQIGFTFLVPARPGGPGQRAVKRVLCICGLFVAASFSYKSRHLKVILSNNSKQAVTTSFMPVCVCRSVGLSVYAQNVCGATAAVAADCASLTLTTQCRELNLECVPLRDKLQCTG